MKSRTRRSRIAAVVLLATMAAACSNEESSSGKLKPVSAADRQAITDVVNALEPSSGVGFAPEVFEQVSDPGKILPAGATVRIVNDTFVVDGDRASVDAVVSIPGTVDTKYWLFLERRAGAWLVAATLELGE